MDRAVITIHLPAHRRASLAAYGESERGVGEAYDRHIGGYLEFLREKGRADGYRIETDPQDMDPVFTIEERDHEQKKVAHEWLRQLPDIWEWIT